MAGSLCGGKYNHKLHGEVPTAMFCQVGLPQVVVSDNATCFTSEAFQRFLKANGIRHTTIAPGHPATNGQAENAVKTLKKAIKKQLGESPRSGEELERTLQNFLFEYRNTPHCTTGRAPAEAIMGRKLIDTLSRLVPGSTKISRVPSLGIKKTKGARAKFDLKSREPSTRSFEVGSAVMVRDFSDPNHRRWMAARVVEKWGKYHYLCELGSGRIRKCHIEQMIQGHDEGEKQTTTRAAENQPITTPMNRPRAEPPRVTERLNLYHLSLLITGPGSSGRSRSGGDAPETDSSEDVESPPETETSGETDQASGEASGEEELSSYYECSPVGEALGESTEVELVAEYPPCPMCWREVREVDMAECLIC